MFWCILRVKAFLFLELWFAAPQMDASIWRAANVAATFTWTQGGASRVEFAGPTPRSRSSKERWELSLSLPVPDARADIHRKHSVHSGLSLQVGHFSFPWTAGVRIGELRLYWPRRCVPNPTIDPAQFVNIRLLASLVLHQVRPRGRWAAAAERPGYASGASRPAATPNVESRSSLRSRRPAAAPAGGLAHTTRRQWRRFSPCWHHGASPPRRDPDGES